jgi:exopolysaccharide production protein ExoY
VHPPTSGEQHQPSKRASGRFRRDSGRSQALIELVRDDEIVLPPAKGPNVPGFAKRTIDIVLSAILIVALLPLWVAVAIVIKLDSKGPVFFAHRRLGKGGRHFDCLKFRTMEVDAEHRVFQDVQLLHHYVSNHFKIPTDLDPRITRIGRFLRLSSLDELPQLWNVFVGEMSLVGPRPIVSLEATHYGDKLGDLLSVRPGITGLWAVKGRSQVGYPQRTELELSYVRTRSLMMDIGIIARTPWTVLTQRGTI